MDESRSARSYSSGMASYYDQLASSYGEGEMFGARRAAMFAAMTPELAHARQVLDLGCGNGTYLAEFVARLPAARVTGADLSGEMLRAAQRRVGARAAVVHADAIALPFSAARFDLVFMSHVLQLVSDVERCVGEVARCLVPGGLWITTIGTMGWRESLLPMLGAEAVQELRTWIGSARPRGVQDDGARVDAACAQVGLEFAWRPADFVVTWAALEEFLRIRWFGVIDDATRTRAETWLARVRPSAAESQLSIAQTLLVARKLQRG